MILNYKQFLNEGLKDILKGFSKEEVKEKLKNLTPRYRYEKIKQLNLTYQDIYTEEEINNFIGLNKLYALNKYDNIDHIQKNTARVYLNNRYGIIDENGNEKELTFEDIFPELKELEMMKEKEK